MTRSPEWAPPGVDIFVPAVVCGPARGVSRTRTGVFPVFAGIDIVEAGTAARDATNAGTGRES
ncbi:hypothetical protein ACWEGE_43900 [Amycolatopsis sp. NPDC004747]